jgi:predicted outer membrane repeat protein
MYASGDSMFESINGLVFVHNVANGFGGGMRAANVAVQNLTFTSNEAAIGGGLSLTVGPAGVPNVVSGCVFEDNAAALGGGAYVGIGAPTVVQDSSFIGNEAYGSGGGLYADGEFGELLVLTDLVFEGNSSENAGGGFFTSGTTEATDIFLTGNTALRGGGAHLTQAPSSVLTRVTAADNMVVAGGGGICFWVASDSIMQECTIMGNMAFEAGGGLIIGGTPGLTLVDTRIVDNVAVLEGGGFWDDSNGLDISGDLTVYNTIAGNHALKGSAVFHGAAFGGSLGDMSAEYTCWGTSKETLVAEGIWDHVDDASLAVVNAYPFVSCFYNCQADCDDNGTLDITDFLCFKSLFDAGDEGADTNGDGELNVLDFVFFQKMFVDGC